MTKNEHKAMNEKDEVGRWTKIDQLHAWDKNPRHHPPAAVREVARSIRRLGWGAPIVARQGNGEVVAGHRRLLAAELIKASWETATKKQRETWHPDAVRTAVHCEVPVRFGDWSESDAHLLALADNKHAENGEYSEGALDALFPEFERYDLEIAGFKASDFGDLGLDSDDGIVISDEDIGGAAQTVADGLTYSVIVDFDNEGDQAELVAELEGRGLSCRMLIS